MKDNGINKRYYYQIINTWEHGKEPDSTYVLKSLCDFLGVGIGQLYGERAVSENDVLAQISANDLELIANTFLGSANIAENGMTSEFWIVQKVYPKPCEVSFYDSKQLADLCVRTIADMPQKHVDYNVIEMKEVIEKYIRPGADDTFQKNIKYFSDVLKNVLHTHCEVEQTNVYCLSDAHFLRRLRCFCQIDEAERNVWIKRLIDKIGFERAVDVYIKNKDKCEGISYLLMRTKSKHKENENSKVKQTNIAVERPKSAVADQPEQCVNDIQHDTHLYKIFLILSTGVHARGLYDSRINRVLIYKGSQIKLGFSSKSASKKDRRYKRQIENKWCEFLDETGNLGRLTSDVEFDSPSSAANILLGSHVSGPQYFQDENGVLLKDFID